MFYNGIFWILDLSQDFDLLYHWQLFQTHQSHSPYDLRFIMPLVLLGTLQALQLWLQSHKIISHNDSTRTVIGYLFWMGYFSLVMPNKLAEWYLNHWREYCNNWRVYCSYLAEKCFLRLIYQVNEKSGNILMGLSLYNMKSHHVMIPAWNIKLDFAWKLSKLNLYVSLFVIHTLSNRFSWQAKINSFKMLCYVIHSPSLYIE